MSNNAVIYARISTQEQNNTINDLSPNESQIIRCKKWIDYKGFKLAGTYTDTKSGTSIDRPELNRLRSDIKKKKIDVIVTARLDRISRNIRDFHNLLEELQNEGVKIVCVDQNIDTTSDNGEFIIHLLIVLAQLESKTISNRTKEQKITAIKNGIWTGGQVPLGYDKTDNGLIKNEDEYELVNYIYDLYLELKSDKKVCHLLNKEGFKNKKWISDSGRTIGGNKFTVDSVRRILMRKLYTGYFEVDGEFYQTKFGAVITSEKFQKAQEVRELNRNNPKGYIIGSAPNLLQGIITCGFCDGAMTNSYTTKKRTGKRYYYYKCSTKNKGETTKSHNPKDLPYKAVDDFTICTIRAFLNEPEMLTAFMKRSEFNKEDSIKSLKDQIKMIRNNRLQFIRDRDTISETLLSNSKGDLRNHWENKLDNTLKRIDQIDHVISEKEEELDSLENSKQISDNQYIEILNEFNSIFQDNPPEVKKEFLRTLIRNVESTVTKKPDNGSSGELRIDYICDHYLLSEWDEIKNANSEGIKVRTSFALGSPGWIRTNDRSVNSRLLCH